MKITQESDYAMRIVLFLSRLGVGTKIEAKVISEAEGVSLRFTLKILRKLTQKGIAASFRGVHGGYALAKDPQEITMKDVIEAVEGEIYINRCLNSRENCNIQRGSVCTVHKELARIQRNLLEDLSSVTFKKLMEEKQ